MIDLTENAPGKIMGCWTIIVIVVVATVIALIVKYLF